MTDIAIVFHSGFGHTQVQANSIAKGAANVEGVSVKQFNVDALSDDLAELDSMDAIVFGSPTYMGAASAPFKAFMDASSRIYSEQRWKDKIAAGPNIDDSEEIIIRRQDATHYGRYGIIWQRHAELGIEPHVPRDSYLQP